MKDLYCACGGKCEGICRKANLTRPRKDGKGCPAAYEKRVEYIKRYEK